MSGNRARFWRRCVVPLWLLIFELSVVAPPDAPWSTAPSSVRSLQEEVDDLLLRIPGKNCHNHPPAYLVQIFQSGHIRRSALSPSCGPLRKVCSLSRHIRSRRRSSQGMSRQAARYRKFGSSVINSSIHYNSSALMPLDALGIGRVTAVAAVRSGP